MGRMSGIALSGTEVLSTVYVYTTLDLRRHLLLPINILSTTSLCYYFTYESSMGINKYIFMTRA